MLIFHRVGAGIDEADRLLAETACPTLASSCLHCSSGVAAVGAALVAIPCSRCGMRPKAR